jgi:hypothetical protein
MTRAVKELAQGQAFGRTVDSAQAADTSERNFRVVLSSPNEVYSPQSVCGVYVGDRHPLNPYMTCSGFDAKFESDSRLVNIITFKYGSNPGQEDTKQQEPSVRPPLWSTSTSLQETPVIVWKRMISDTASYDGKWTAPVNPAGDRYEGISKLEPITTISVEQYEAIDPTRNIKYVGRVNSTAMALGSLVMPPRSVMLRGLQSKPHVEPFGNLVWRGWICTYEFAFRDNFTTYYGAYGESRDSIGWDITQIVEGYNIINTGLDDAAVDQGALAYTLDEYGAVTPSWGARTLVETNKKYRACVKVSAPGGDPNRKISQRPSAQPVALNADGSPRDVNSQTPKVLVWRYQIYEDCNFKAVLGLRF